MAKVWSFREIPTASNLNALSNTAVAAKNIARILAAVGNGPATGVNRRLLLQNRHRWLVYKSEPVEYKNPPTDMEVVTDSPGEVEPIGVHISDETSLPRSDDPDDKNSQDWKIFDLRQLSWMVPGRLYRVHHVVWAFEIPYVDRLGE